MQNIIEVINTQAETIEEDKLDSIVDDLLDTYKLKLNFLAKKAYGFRIGEAAPEVTLLAFKEQAREELKSSLFTFLFTSEHWRTGRDVNPYLITVLNRLSERIRQDIGSIKKANVLICPLCRENNHREFLNPEAKLWRCQTCTGLCERLTEELDKGLVSGIDRMNLEIKLAGSKIFSLHSRKGFKCPDCKRFIPESANTSYGISCPYSNCGYVGTVSWLEKINHPATSCQRQAISLNSVLSKSDNNSNDLTLESTLESGAISADSNIDVKEKINHELDVLNQVIDDQIILIKRANSPGTIVQKLCMYEAYKNMIVKSPEEMITYLVHQKQTSESPIQARIFQEYADLVENYLPCTITKGGATIDIVDLLDLNLGLFLGISNYEAIVRNDYTIPNNTKEEYVGGKKYINYGPCFIGKLIDVKINDKASESLKKHVKNYSFVDIKLDEGCVAVGTHVLVSHFRIASHYELNSLVHLQRIRRALVDRIYIRLNGKKREIKQNINRLK